MLATTVWQPPAISDPPTGRPRPTHHLPPALQLPFTGTFSGEVAIHIPGLEGQNEPTVWVFPQILLCLNCGVAQFLVLKLSMLAKKLIAKLRRILSAKALASVQHIKSRNHES